jgi:hypothetical protein
MLFRRLPEQECPTKGKAYEQEMLERKEQENAMP